MGQALGQAGGQVDHRFLDIRAGQGHHLLTGTDHLAGFGIPRGDNASVVGTQFGVVELVLGLVDGGLCLVKRGLGGFKVGLGDIQLGLSADATVEQFLLTASIGLGVDELRLHASQIALGGAQLVLLVSGVEDGKQGALLHLGAHVHGAAGNAAGHAEAQVAFITGLDGAGETAEVFLILGFHFHRQHRPHRLGRRFFLGAGHQQQAGGEYSRQALHGWAPGWAISTIMPGCSNCPPATTTFSPPLRPSPMMTLPVR